MSEADDDEALWHNIWVSNNTLLQNQPPLLKKNKKKT